MVTAEIVHESSASSRRISEPRDRYSRYPVLGAEKNPLGGQEPLWSKTHAARAALDVKSWFDMDEQGLLPGEAGRKPVYMVVFLFPSSFFLPRRAWTEYCTMQCLVIVHDLSNLAKKVPPQTHFRKVGILCRSEVLSLLKGGSDSVVSTPMALFRHEDGAHHKQMVPPETAGSGSTTDERSADFVSSHLRRRDPAGQILVRPMHSPGQHCQIPPRRADWQVPIHALPVSQLVVLPAIGRLSSLADWQADG